ncbi:MAG: AAA family ATPase [Syntrophobacteraceae bacterium]
MEDDEKTKQDVMTSGPAGATFTTGETFTHKELMNAEFREPAWIIPGLIPEGQTLIAGKSKIGKSLLLLGLASRVAEGGKAFDKIDVEPKEILYLALEDSPKRLQKKLRAMNGEAEGSGRLHFATSGPKKGESATSFLEKHIGNHPFLKCIIIDTLGRFCGRGISSYKGSYDQMAEIKAVADKYALAIIVVHHARKVKAEDPFDCILGSTGLAGSADTLAVLTRDRGQNDALLIVCGREVEERELAMQFEPENLSWKLIGPANEVRMSQERQEVLDLLRKENKDMRLKDIAEALDKKRPVLVKLLGGLVDAGLVEQPKYGLYKAVLTSNPEIENSGELGESSDKGETQDKGETDKIGDNSITVGDADGKKDIHISMKDFARADRLEELEPKEMIPTDFDDEDDDTYWIDMDPAATELAGRTQELLP